MTVVDHITTIDRALTGKDVTHDTVVVDSWRRCVERYGLDPVKPNAPQIIPETQLREHRERSERLMRFARSSVKTLSQQIACLDYVVLLADSSGIAIDQFGTSQFEASLKESGLTVGANWSEKHMGTSGIGTVLETSDALSVHLSDHFNLSHVGLTCTAAPIFNTDGTLATILDISRLHAPQDKISQDFALTLVKATARRIEMANLEATAPSDLVLRFSVLPDLLDVDPYAAVSVDSSGRIVGATYSAIRFLSKSKGSDSQTPGHVIGRNVSDFFDLNLQELPRLNRSRSPEERVLKLRNGTLVFGQSATHVPNRKSRVNLPEPSPIQKALGRGDVRIETLAKRANRLATTNIPILIHGETGTGKDRLARAIHSIRGMEKPFVAINCAALPANDLDGYLFGTYGKSGRSGQIEIACGGTLFLDEIGDLPFEAQARLLRALDDGQIRPTGGGASLNINFRLISSTQRDLAKRVVEGKFRQDLFFRIAPAVLEIPPLRERSDTEEVAQRILRTITIARPEAWRLTRAAHAEILRRKWLGNLRELRDALDVAMVLADRPIIDAEDIPPSAFEPEIPFDTDTDTDTEDLRALLEVCEWNLSRTARRLGVDRSTVHRRMQRCGIQRP